MPRRCTICEHAQRQDIDKALVSGESLRSLKARFGVSASALSRHRKSHLAPLLAQVASGHETAGPAPPPSNGHKGKTNEPIDSVRDAHASELLRHRRSLEAVEAVHALDVVQQLKAVNGACLEVLAKARAREKSGTLLQAVDRIHRQIEIQSRLLSSVPESTDASVESRWPEIRNVLVEALGPHPDAMRAVAEALSRVGA